MEENIRKKCYWGFLEDIEPSEHRKIAFFSVSEGNGGLEKHLYRACFFAKTSYFTVFDYAQQFLSVFEMIWKNFKKSTFLLLVKNGDQEVKNGEIWSFLRKNMSYKGVFYTLISFIKLFFDVQRALYQRESKTHR